jgi:integrase
MMALGLSPIQLVALKVGHFQIKKGYHFVDVLCRRPSDHRKTRKIPLTPQFAPPFELHIKQIVKEYRKAVQKSERIPEAELPIFPARKRGSDSYDYTRQLTVSGVLSELQKVYALLNLPPRLKLSPDSVRRTLARMMAIRDSSPKVFTEWFDYQESQDMRLNSFRHWLWAAWNEQRL